MTSDVRTIPAALDRFADQSPAQDSLIPDERSFTGAAIDSEGRLDTGDIGEVDERGNLCITDRLEDMYIRGGFNVYPAEIGGKVVKPQLREHG